MKNSFIFKVLLYALVFLAVPMPANAQVLANPIRTRITNGGGIQIRLQTVADGLTAPNWGTAPRGDTTRLYVTDQIGIVWEINLLNLSRRAFLDVRTLLVPLSAAGDERGLLGLAFHPDYATNGLFYTYSSEPVSTSVAADFTTQPSGTVADHQSVVSEWQVANPGDPVPIPGPARRILLRIDQPQANHNAGALNFGPDGLLYIALGDGGGADDEGVGHSAIGNGQDTTTVLGKILRIDPNGRSSPNGQYSIPLDNPFISAGQIGLFTGRSVLGGQQGCFDSVCDEIYASGFRNPFRFSFDRATGLLLAGDVGQNNIEEVDVVTRGGNYGWPIKEGTFLFNNNGAGAGFVIRDIFNARPDLLNPIAQYDHDDGIAIVGGFVYRGRRIAALRGRYVFGDFSRRSLGNSGRLFHFAQRNLDQTPQALTNINTLRRIREFRIVGRRPLGLALLGFGQDERGELYVMGNTTSTPVGATGVVLTINRAPPPRR
jgi:glucose/arabinose dehydrogenase